MASLPTPGGDDGTWGSILNEYLEVAHTSAGRLKSTGALFVAANDASDASKAVARYICDGTADDVEIQAAIDALSSNSGKVILSEGTFNISSTINIQNDNVTLIGAGAGQKTDATQTGVGTKLQAVSGITTQVLLVQRAADDRPVYGTLLRDFTIDGGNIAGPVDGLVFRSNRGHVDHVHVHRCSGNGFKVQGYGSWATYDTTLAFCQAGDNTLDGILFDANADDCHLLSCIVYNSGQDNFHLKAASVQVTGCHLYNPTRYNIFIDNAGSRSKISNCKIEGAGQHGLIIDATTTGQSDIQITGCNFKTNGDSADNTYDHVILKRDSGSQSITRTTLVGNNFSWTSGNKPRYGINLSGAVVQSANVQANSFGSSSHFGTSPMNIDSNADAIVRDNVGFVTEVSETTTISTGTSGLTTHFADDFSPDTIDTWGSPDTGSAYTYSGNTGTTADHDKTGGEGTQTHSSSNLTRNAIMSVSLADFEFLVKTGVSILPTGTGSAYSILNFRFADTANHMRFHIEYAVGGQVSIDINRFSSSGDLYLGEYVLPNTYVAEDRYWFKGRVEGSSFKLKAWKVGTIEPGWLMQVTDNVITSAGSIRLSSFITSGVTNTPAVFYWDDLSITSLSTEPSITVTHGLGRTPALKNIEVTPTNSLGNGTKYWISDITATTFKINLNTDPGATGATFSWKAKIL